MARASKGKLRYLRNYYMTLTPTFYIDRQGRHCIAHRGKSFVNVKLEGSKGVPGHAGDCNDQRTFEISFTGFN